MGMDQVLVMHMILMDKEDMEEMVEMEESEVVVVTEEQMEKVEQPEVADKDKEDIGPRLQL
jgi:hypothetical protein